MTDQIKVVFAPMDGAPCVRRVDPSDAALEEMVGAPMQIVRVSDECIAVYSSIGEELGFPRNRFIRRKVYGNLVFVKTEPGSDERVSFDDGWIMLAALLISQIVMEVNNAETESIDGAGSRYADAEGH